VDVKVQSFPNFCGKFRFRAIPVSRGGESSEKRCYLAGNEWEGESSVGNGFVLPQSYKRVCRDGQTLAFFESEKFPERSNDEINGPNEDVGLYFGFSVTEASSSPVYECGP
jgi:hypothetical protein